MNKNGEFLDDNYDVPEGDSKFMKLLQGENKIRILSKPIYGWLDWLDKKPHRFHMEQKPDKPYDPKKAIKHFWALVVWDYEKECISVLEITQKTIQSVIANYSRDAEWGSPFGYDFKITRTGEGLKTEYSCIPSPHKEVAAKIKEAYAATPVNLAALYEGEDPFDVSIEDVQAVNDLPF